MKSLVAILLLFAASFSFAAETYRPSKFCSINSSVADNCTITSDIVNGKAVTTYKFDSNGRTVKVVDLSGDGGLNYVLVDSTPGISIELDKYHKVIVTMDLQTKIEYQLQ